MNDTEKLKFYQQFLEDIATEDDPHNYGAVLPVLAAKALSLDTGCDGCIHNRKHEDLKEYIKPCEECMTADFWMPTIDYVNEYYDLLVSAADEE